MTGRTSKAFKGTVASFAQYAIFIILQVILTPLILKIAGQEVLGAYSIIMQIVGYGILLDLGFSVALGRFLSQTYGLNDNGKKFIEIFNIGRVFLLVSNSVFAALIMLVALKIGDLIVASEVILTQARTALFFLAIWTIAKTPLALYNNGLMATQNMATANLIAIVGNMSRLMLSIILVYSDFGLIGLITANIFSELLAFTIQMKYFKKKYPHYSFGWKIVDKGLFKEMFFFGVKYSGVNFAAILFLGSDSIIVGNLYGASEAAVFYTTKMPAFLLFQFIFRLSDNAASATNELFAQRNYEALGSAYLKILRYSLLLVFPLAIGLVVFNESLILLWIGRAQYAGDIMTTALAIFAITQVINHINAMITLASGNLRSWTTISIVTSILSLALSYILGKMYGIEWVMVAIILMDIPNLLFLFKRSLISLNLPAIRLWYDAFQQSLLACLPLVGLALYLKITSPIETLFSLIFFVAVFMVVWATSLLVLGLNSSEKKYLTNKISYIFHHA